MLRQLLASEILKVPDEELELKVLGGKLDAIPEIEELIHLEELSSIAFRKYECLESKTVKINLKRLEAHMVAAKHYSKLDNEEFFV